MHDNQTSPIVPIGVDGTLNVDYTCTFRGVAASDELRIEFWTLSIGTCHRHTHTHAHTCTHTRTHTHECEEARPDANVAVSC